MHPINTSYEHILSIHPVNTSYQYTLSIHQIKPILSKCLLSLNHPLSISILPAVPYPTVTIPFLLLFYLVFAPIAGGS